MMHDGDEATGQRQAVTLIVRVAEILAGLCRAPSQTKAKPQAPNSAPQAKKIID